MEKLAVEGSFSVAASGSMNAGGKADQLVNSDGAYKRRK